MFHPGFYKIAALLTSILKTTRSLGSTLRELRVDDDEIVGRGGKADDRNLSKSKKSKNAKSGIQTRAGATGEPIFLTPGNKKTFNQLKQALTKAPISQYFDLECYIRIETNASGYALGRVLSQLTSDHLTLDQGQWQPVAYFLRKMILAKTRYKTYDSERLAIVKAFKTWKYYLKGCKHKVLVLTDHNNLCQFIDIKSLSFRQVQWAQKLS